jgi:putative DNA primase/helicase
MTADTLIIDLACELRDSRLPDNIISGILIEYASKVDQDRSRPFTSKDAGRWLDSALKKSPREPATLPGDRNNGYHPEPELPAESRLAPNEPTPGFYKLDDIGNGERMSHRHGYKIRYVKEWGWMVWNGRNWQADRGEVARMAKETSRSIFAEAAKVDDDDRAKAIGKHASASASQARRVAMIEACGSEPGITATPQQFDGNPWLLNCPNGILDLRTGELRPHDPKSMLSKIAGADYNPAAACPTWITFLDRIFNSDQATIGFIQRAIGYSLTGDVGEQCLFFAHGDGANGKSTLNGAVHTALGDYATKTPVDTLMIKRSDGGINNDVARLAGARAVFATEVTEGKRLDESLVKDLTGGDVITARYLHREFFEFTPVFKLWLYGNHKPAIRGTDEGIWRRIKLIPFEVTIPEAEWDRKLPEKLRGELAGILAWAVKGCLAWQKEGLQPPKKVKDATQAFRQQEDVLGKFIDECCIKGEIASVTAGDLLKTYRLFTGNNDMAPQTFSKIMQESGYVTNGKDNHGRALYKGLGLLTLEGNQDA